MSEPAGRERRNAPLNAIELRELRLEIEELNTEYGHALDSGDLERWPGFFAEDAVYRITGRENFDADLPIGLIYCDGAGMLWDRVHAIRKTTTYAPRYLRHFFSGTRITGIAPDGIVGARTNYLVLQTQMETETRILQSGFYEDRLVRRLDRLLIKERHCVYDTLTIPNSLILPV